MASLVGQQLKDTYDSLLKTSDNDALGGTYKEITDGSGNGSNLYLGTGGNVGIGGSPSVPLEITGSASTMLAFNRNSGSSDVSLRFKTNTGNPDGTFLNGGGPLALFRFYTESTERMRITSGGDISFRDGSTNEAFYWDASEARLGLGTTSPSVKLQVYGSPMPENTDPAGVEDILTLYRTGSVNVWSGGATLALGRYTTGDGANPNSRLDFKLKDATGSNTALPEVTVMTMQSDGRVGIGTTSPDVELDVEGEVRASSGILFGTDTASANALDDYEEGTTTATFTATTSGTITVNTSFDTVGYTKIGDICHVQGRVYVSSVASPVGNVRINCLPFVSISQSETPDILSANVTFINAGTYTVMPAEIIQNSQYITVIMDASTVSASNYFNIQVTYKTA